MEVIIKLGILNIPVRSLWFGYDRDCRRIGVGIVGVWLDRIDDGVRNRSRDCVIEALEVGVAGGDGAGVAFPDTKAMPEAAFEKYVSLLLRKSHLYKDDMSKVIIAMIIFAE